MSTLSTQISANEVFLFFFKKKPFIFHWDSGHPGVRFSVFFFPTATIGAHVRGRSSQQKGAYLAFWRRASCARAIIRRGLFFLCCCCFSCAFLCRIYFVWCQNVVVFFLLLFFVVILAAFVCPCRSLFCHKHVVVLVFAVCKHN